MYSKRTGTPAATFENQVDEEVKNIRVNKLLRLQKIISKDLLKKNIDKTYNCLIKFVNGVAVGLTDGGREIYIPTYHYKNENYFADITIDGIRNHKLSGVLNER
jgi:tRNA A37 methylthiotransferase MiaB